MTLWSLDPRLPGVLSEADRFPGAAARVVDLFLNHPVRGGALIEACQREGLSGLLYAVLAQHHRPMDDPAAVVLLRRVRGRYLFALKTNLVLLDRCADICRALNAARIPVVLLQGASLIGTAYADCGMRPMSDLDLWIREGDFQKAASVFDTLGFGADPLYPMTFVQGAVHLDVHTDLFWGERIAARKGLIAMPQERIFSDSEACSVGGAGARRLAASDQILYLSMHVLKHNADRLIWLVDIKRLLSKFSDPGWEALVARAQDFGIAHQLAGVLFLIRTLFADLRWPKAAHAFIDSQGLNAIERFCFRRRRHRPALPILFSLLFITGLKDPGQAVRLLVESLYPRPEILRQVFPEASGETLPRLYAKRTAQLAASLLPKFDRWRGAIGP